MIISQIEKINKILIFDQIPKNIEVNLKDRENQLIILVIANGKDQNGKLKVNIQGVNANICILGMVIGYGNQQITVSIAVEHPYAGSNSSIFIKSVLFDKAKYTYSGLLKIEKNAIGTHAYQKNQNMLMSDQAEARSLPNLEIKENEVYCSHGSTTATVSEDQLFFLYSRGLNQKEATKLLLMGFFREIIMKITDEKSKKDMEEKLDKKMNQLITKIYFPNNAYDKNVKNSFQN